MQMGDPEKWSKDETLVTLYNPIDKEVRVEILDDENIPVKYVLEPYHSYTFPKYIGDIIEKHLLDAIKNHRSIGLTNANDIEELKKEIYR